MLNKLWSGKTQYAIVHKHENWDLFYIQGWGFFYLSPTLRPTLGLTLHLD